MLDVEKKTSTISLFVSGNNEEMLHSASIGFLINKKIK